MKYCRIPPGDDPMADAYNLMVCAHHAQQSPEVAKAAERMARTITSRVTDWEDVAANLAILAAKFANFCDQAMPEEVDGKKYDRPSEKIRLAIEANNLIPA